MPHLPKSSVLSWSFDAFTRRVALRAAAGSTLAALLTRLGPGQAAAACRRARRPCRRNAQCCSGACRRRKGKKTCRGNGSSPPPSPPDCPAGERLCPEGVCRPVAECCTVEKACNGGCIPVEECCGGCATGETCCPSPRFGICVDLENDPLNCGICTLICPTGNTCESGECVA